MRETSQEVFVRVVADYQNFCQSGMLWNFFGFLQNRIQDDASQCLRVAVFSMCFFFQRNFHTESCGHIPELPTPPITLQQSVFCHVVRQIAEHFLSFKLTLIHCFFHC